MPAKTQPNEGDLMGVLDFLFGTRVNNGRLEAKIDELTEQVHRLERTQREVAFQVVKELKELRSFDHLSREEVLRRIESIQEKLQFATEEYVATDEDVKQMIRNCLKSRAKTFNELQKETKISPQTLLKYLRMMRNEVEEFNGVYRVVFSSSLIYIGKDEEGQFQDLVKADALYGTEE